MKRNLLKDIRAINQLSLVDYLTILGCKPAAWGPDFTDFYSPLESRLKNSILTVNHKTNCFTGDNHRQQGTLVEFACLLHGCTAKELCDNIVLYRIEQLMRPKIYRLESAIECMSRSLKFERL